MILSAATPKEKALVKVDHAFGQLRQMKEGKLQGVNADDLLLQFQQENGISQETLDEWADQHLRALVKVDHAFGQLRQMKEGKLQGVNADDLLNEL